MRAPVILFGAAFVIRLAAVFHWQFDGLYGQDPFAYVNQAAAISDALPHPPPTDFFWPNGYPLLIVVFSQLAGSTTLAGQLAALLCGAMLSPLVYLLTRDLYTANDSLPVGEGDQASLSLEKIKEEPKVSKIHWAGLLAGLIVAAAGQPILSSIVIMADMPALFWATLSAWLAVRACASERSRPSAFYFLAAGATLGLAIITRWIYGLVTPALVAYTLFELRHRRRSWWTPLPAIVSGFTILLPQLWLSFSQPQGLVHSWLTGWQPLNFFLREFETIDGRFSYLLPGGIYYAQPAGHPAYIFPLLGLGAAWGLWQLWRTRQWGAIILLLGWIMPVYLFLGGIPYQNFRFGLTLYVPLVVLTGIGLSNLLNSATKKTASPPHALIPAALPISIITLSLLGMLAWAYPMLNTFLQAQNHSKRIARQVEQSLPPQATVLAFGLTLTLQHYTQLNTLELFHQTEHSLDTLTASDTPLYLLLDLDNIQHQWPGKIPDVNYGWLESNAVLTKIGEFPPYTLFRVERSISYGVLRSAYCGIYNYSIQNTHYGFESL